MTFLHYCIESLLFAAARAAGDNPDARVYLAWYSRWEGLQSADYVASPEEWEALLDLLENPPAPKRWLIEALHARQREVDAEARINEVYRELRSLDPLSAEHALTLSRLHTLQEAEAERISTVFRRNTGLGDVDATLQRADELLAKHEKN